jgi:hypothetical protein
MLAKYAQATSDLDLSVSLEAVIFKLFCRAFGCEQTGPT